MHVNAPPDASSLNRACRIIRRPNAAARDVAKAQRLGGGIGFLPTNSKVYRPKKYIAMCILFLIDTKFRYIKLGSFNQGLLNAWTATTPCFWKIPDASLADKI